MNQNILTPIIGVLCMAIPLFFLWRAVSLTPSHPFACSNCDADVPLGHARCPRCGAPVADQDQPL
jgi:predicted amidophosphoribosyltransferase